jgi:hypothetical protein
LSPTTGLTATAGLSLTATTSLSATSRLTATATASLSLATPGGRARLLAATRRATAGPARITRRHAARIAGARVARH